LNAYFIGIDPGITGAIAVIDGAGRVLVVADLPTIQSGNGKVKRAISGIGIYAILRPWMAGRMLVALEKPGSMPGQGVASMFSMGESFGVIRGVLEAHAVPYTTERPAGWKKSMGLSKEKELVRAWALRAHPEVAGDLLRKKDHNRAEAIALAHLCWLRR
jgi:crossover junction endodeoxyribonuclease RuvC